MFPLVSKMPTVTHNRSKSVEHYEYYIYNRRDTEVFLYMLLVLFERAFDHLYMFILCFCPSLLLNLKVYIEIRVHVIS